jgi:hypothetical protein
MKGEDSMGKYLVLWEMDESRIPVDPKARGTAWKGLMELVKKGLETGPAKDWGAFVGENKGYVIHEGAELEVAATLQQYVPFARFKVYPVMTVAQIDQLVESLLG